MKKKKLERQKNFKVIPAKFQQILSQILSEEEVDKTIKYSFIYGCKSGATLGEIRIFYEVVQCLLRNFNPVNMLVIFPDVLNDIKGGADSIDIVNSSLKLPKTCLTIQSNLMIGPKFVQ